MFAGVLAFVLQRPALIGLAALALGLVIQSARLDHAKGDLKALNGQIQAARALAKVKTAEAQSIATQAGSDAAKTQTQIVYRTRTLIQKAHDEKDAIGSGALGPLGLQLYDESLGLSADAGAPERAAGGAGLPTSDAWPTVIANNGSCVSEKARADALVRLWDATREKINGR